MQASSRNNGAMTPCTNGHGADVSQLLDMLGARGLSPADVVDLLHDLDNEDGDELRDPDDLADVDDEGDE